MTPENVHQFFAKLLKANLWEVLAIIGAAQLLIMPVIAAGPRRAGRHARWRWPRRTWRSRTSSISTSSTAARTGWTTSWGRRLDRLGRRLLRPALVGGDHAGGHARL